MHAPKVNASNYVIAELAEPRICANVPRPFPRVCGGIGIRLHSQLFPRLHVIVEKYPEQGHMLWLVHLKLSWGYLPLEKFPSELPLLMAGTACYGIVSVVHCPIQGFFNDIHVYTHALCLSQSVYILFVHCAVYIYGSAIIWLWCSSTMFKHGQVKWLLLPSATS